MRLYLGILFIQIINNIILFTIMQIKLIYTCINKIYSHIYVVNKTKVNAESMNLKSKNSAKNNGSVWSDERVGSMM